MFASLGRGVGSKTGAEAENTVRNSFGVFLFLFQSQNKAKQCRDAANEAGDALFATELVFFSATIYQHTDFDKAPAKSPKLALFEARFPLVTYLEINEDACKEWQPGGCLQSLFFVEMQDSCFH